AIALLGLSGDKSQLIFARAKDAPGQMNELLKPALQILRSAAGGGSPTYAQGGGPVADLERLEQALDHAERLLLAQLHYRKEEKMANSYESKTQALQKVPFFSRLKADEAAELAHRLVPRHFGPGQVIF